MTDKLHASRRTVLAGMLATPAALMAKVSTASACSLAFVNNRRAAKIVVRSMDLPVALPERPTFVVFPRGMARDSQGSVLPGIHARIEGVPPNTMRWTSKFGCAAMVSFEGTATDGLNEKGLAAHMLVLDQSALEAADDRPILPDTHWGQYVLDNFATVKEVVDAHQAAKFRIAAAWSSDLGLAKHLGVHLAVQDASGDSAVLEFVKGKLVIHHGPEYRIMTNDPPYDEMMALAKEYAPFGGTKPLPGDVGAVDRFVRLAEYSRYLPEPKTYVQAVAGAFSLLRTAQVAFRDPTRVAGGNAGFWGAVQTNWVSAADLTNRIYYVNGAAVPSLLWIDLKKVNFGKGAPLLFLNPHDPKVGGDARTYLKRWAKR
ncbi:linear amide C-N hydrolase [Bradyrhizobium sp.]|uniref:linear amide C-N hydrolase n=1 Tax=Bradyrhizobium sp. TaxID=376 RepID=UPI0040377702